MPRSSFPPKLLTSEWFVTSKSMYFGGSFTGGGALGSHLRTMESSAVAADDDGEYRLAGC